MTIKVVGLYFVGLKSYFLIKIKDTKGHLICGQKFIFLSCRSFLTVVKANKRIGPHPLEILDVLIGTLLGDAYASKRSIEGTRFAYRQSIIHKDYLFFLYSFFNQRGYCSNLEPRECKTNLKDKTGYKKEYVRYEFQTFTFRSFDFLHKLFYHKGKKVIKPELENYLSARALAFWIMDDGGWVSSSKSVKISVNSFTLQEVQLLIQILKRKFDLNCTIQKLTNRYPDGSKIRLRDQYNINIKVESLPKLRALILPYLHSSMKYKIGL